MKNSDDAPLFGPAGTARRTALLRDHERHYFPVTRPHLPDRARFQKYVDSIFELNWHTNNGPLVQELTKRLESYLGVQNLLLVANGTLALQVAYRALGLTGAPQAEAVTSPFSFVATASSLTWEGLTPVFADIDPATFCLDPDRIAAAITPRTRAIVPVHVYGNCCDVAAIAAIADEHGLKTVYDAAHAFGVRYRGESILNHGDAATLSFHATKLFHTCEGGAIVFRRREDLEKARLLINFGIHDAETIGPPGINAKMSELHAAMGLCVLDDIDDILDRRAELCAAYERVLGDHFQLPRWNPEATRNHAYFPILFESETALKDGMAALEKSGIGTRRYFYPSLDTLDYLQPQPGQPVCRDIARRILCLPVPAPGIDCRLLGKALTTLRGPRR